MQKKTIDLDTVAARLEGLEETIISTLIERAQYCENRMVYQAGQSNFTGFEGESLFFVRMRLNEEMDAQFGRFCVPEERPFCHPLPLPRRVVKLPDTGLVLADFNSVNLTAKICKSYQSLLPALCKPGDDGQYGSSVEHDVAALQAISRRIHYGAFYVAESKFAQNTGSYCELIDKNDREALMALLTRREVEDRIIERVREKVAYAQARVNTLVRSRIDPELVLRYYRDTIIPLTKEGEIEYLFHRNRSE